MHTYICVCMHIHYTQLFLELSTYQFVALQFKNTFFSIQVGRDREEDHTGCFIAKFGSTSLLPVGQNLVT